MGGTLLAGPRRRASRLFTERVFVGDAIDIGAGPDPITTEGFPLLRSVREWDKNDGDATLMLGVDRQYDLIYSSHCVEHLDRPIEAVRRWWELVAIGGHLVIVAPDEELYERFEWPSTKNLDHRFSFTTITRNTPPRMPNGVRMQLLAEQCAGGRLISLVRLEDGFDRNEPRDQTALGNCECGIELVIRKES